MPSFVVFFFLSPSFQLIHAINFLWVYLLQQQDLVTTARTRSGERHLESSLVKTSGGNGSWKVLGQGAGLDAPCGSFQPEIFHDFKSRLRLLRALSSQALETLNDTLDSLDETQPKMSPLSPLSCCSQGGTSQPTRAALGSPAQQGQNVGVAKCSSPQTQPWGKGKKPFRPPGWIFEHSGETSSVLTSISLCIKSVSPQFLQGCSSLSGEFWHWYSCYFVENCVFTAQRTILLLETCSTFGNAA